MSAQEKYIYAVERGLDLGGYHAMWPPGKPATVGGIGRFNGRAFDQRGHLQDYEQVDEDVTDSQADGLVYGQGRGVDVELIAGGESGAVAKALLNVDIGVKLTFHEKDQVAVRAVGVRYPQVRDVRRFAERVISAFHNGHVEYDDLFVTGIITADSGAAAVSAVAGASLELTGQGNVAPGASVTLGSLQAGISIANSTHTSLAVPMTSGFVVAVRLVSLDRKGIFKVQPVVRDVPTFDNDAGFERDYVVTFDDVSPPLED